jgi:hypothetical protein
MSDRIWVATRKGLFTVERAAGTARWSVSRAAFLGDNLTFVLPDRRDGSVYASIHHGHFGDKVHCSTDGGETWQPCATPEYPKQPEGAEPDLHAWRKTPIAWKLELIWSLAAGGADEPGVLWAGTLPGGLFRSTDRGQSWTLNRPLWDDPARKQWFGGGMDLPGIHSICVDPRDSRHVTVGISCGGVWATRDGGDTWQCQATGMRADYMPPEQQGNPNIQDPHCVVQCRVRPDVFWAQHHNGVFRSTDGAASWQEVTGLQPSSFGFPVAVHPADPDTAWFVPAIKDERRIPVGGKVVVVRTRDGGRTSEVLTRGLPDQHAYDLVFRHGLDVDPSGNRLAFGSTTGSLWVSEDQGDHWQCVSSHLPPIYCVRFGA